MDKNFKRPSFTLSLVLITLMTVVMATGIVLFKGLELSMLLLVIILMIGFVSKLFLGYSFEDMMEFISTSIKNSTQGLWFFIAIGTIIAAWMISGTVPTIIYYGLSTINPHIFLPAGFILSSIMSMSTGSSWATIGTVGIALMGVGSGMGIPIPITAGMIVSGASFGDKLSPVSDTPNLISTLTGTNLYDTLKSFIKNLIPAFLIALVLFTLLGLKFSSNTMSYELIDETKEILKANFNLSPFTLIPIIVLFILSFKRFPSLPTMAITVIISLAIAFIFQGKSFVEGLQALYGGFSIETGSKYIDPLLNRGGILNILPTFMIAFLAISMGSLLDRCGYLEVLLGRITDRITSAKPLSIMVLMTSFLATALIGEVYLSFILNSTYYKRVFEKLKIDKTLLNRWITDTGYLLAPFLPWTTYGAFCKMTFGISGFKFFPYTFLNILAPLISILLVYFNIDRIRRKNA